MSKHIIELHDIKQYEYKVQIASAYGGGNNKSLELVMSPGWDFPCLIVTNERVVVYTGKSLEDAVSIYNKY